MQIFQMFDKDGSGAIDAEELHEALKSMGHNLSKEDVSKMMQDADDDGKSHRQLSGRNEEHASRATHARITGGGEIDFEEFCKLMGMDSGAAAEKVRERPMYLVVGGEP